MRKPQVIKNLNSVVHILRDYERDGTLGPKQSEVARKAVRDLNHGIRAGDSKQVAEAINRIAELFLRDLR